MAKQDRVLQNNFTGQKSCNWCKQIKPLGKFPKQDNCRDGRRNVCLSCRSDRSLSLYYKNHEHKLAQAAKYRAKNPNKQRTYRADLKREVLEHYSGGAAQCAKCGFDDIRALCIDHINGNGAEHRRTMNTTSSRGAGTAIYTWLRKNNYPSGFQVLCSNCNRIKEHEQRGFGVRESA